MQEAVRAAIAWPDTAAHCGEGADGVWRVSRALCPAMNEASDGGLGFFPFCILKQLCVVVCRVRSRVRLGCLVVVRTYIGVSRGNGDLRASGVLKI